MPMTTLWTQQNTQNGWSKFLLCVIHRRLPQQAGGTAIVLLYLAMWETVTSHKSALDNILIRKELFTGGCVGMRWGPRWMSCRERRSLEPCNLRSM